MILHPGDKVRIVRMIAEWEGNHWVPSMDRYVNNGMVYTVQHADDYEARLIDDPEGWAWPVSCFQKAGKPSRRSSPVVAANSPATELAQRSVTLGQLRDALLGPEEHPEEEDMDDLDFVEDDYDDIEPDEPADYSEASHGR